MQLEAKDVSFRYMPKGSYILRNLSFSVSEGERVGIIAPSGAGKTTLVQLLAGYERPTDGEILLDGRPLPKKGRLPVQLISQHPETAVNPRLRMRSVLEEVGACEPELIKAMGIEEQWLRRYPRELSGGELQRFCIARALISDARFIIADEISAMLDVISQAQIWQYLLAETERRRIGLIAVTHSKALADRVCSRIYKL